ncbi:C39 family peptidase [Micromonospora sp. NPDC048999]|uniref:C39 family peptidase n=1 Tax=Micromonospora sp. NPDC048999 TaxID=3155391 RepID=UPI0033F43AE7
MLAAGLVVAGFAGPASAGTGSSPVSAGGVLPNNAPSDATARNKETQASAGGGFSVLATSESKRLTITTQAQETNYWCSPAAGRAALSALSATVPSQSTLAWRMDTTSSGTVTTNIAPSLNAYQSKNNYVRSTGMTLDNYRTYLRAGIVTYAAPSILNVQMSKLPWYSNVSGGHSVTSYGYATATKVWNLDIYDPWDNIRHTGTASGTMYDAAINNHEMIW